MDEREFEEYWESVKVSFLKIWIRGFAALRGWTEAQTLEWAAKWHDAFEAKDEGRIFFHQSAEEWMVFELFSESLKTRLRQRDAALPRRPELEARLSDAIRGAHPRIEVENFTDQDWQAAKLRVQAVLGEFGETLPLL